MEWIRINRKWENRTWDVSSLTSFSREHLFFPLKTLSIFMVWREVKGRSEYESEIEEIGCLTEQDPKTRRRLHLILAKRAEKMIKGEIGLEVLKEGRRAQILAQEENNPGQVGIYLHHRQSPEGFSSLASSSLLLFCTFRVIIPPSLLNFYRDIRT